MGGYEGWTWTGTVALADRDRGPRGRRVLQPGALDLRERTRRRRRERVGERRPGVPKGSRERRDDGPWRSRRAARSTAKRTDELRRLGGRRGERDRRDHGTVPLDGSWRMVALTPVTGSAKACNADGSIVVGWTGFGTITHAFIWDASHGVRDLNDVLVTDYGLGTDLAGWTLYERRRMADGTVIVGHGSDPGGVPRAWIVDLGDGPASPMISFAIREKRE